MADTSAYEIFEVGVHRGKKGKSAIRQFLEAWIDFTGGVIGQFKVILCLFLIPVPLSI